MIADTNGTLFERPNVRVSAVPANMCPARESRLWRDAKRRGALSWGYPFFGRQRRGTAYLACHRIVCFLLCASAPPRETGFLLKHVSPAVARGR
jgi:hypothetical protein